MVLIFYLSSLPKPPVPHLDWKNTDKLYHFLGYTALGFLVVRAFLHTSPKIFLGSPWIAAVLVVALYAASDEWHQSFVPGRTSEIADWGVDCLGGVLGTLAMYVWHRFSKKRIRNTTFSVIGKSKVQTSEVSTHKVNKDDASS